MRQSLFSAKPLGTVSAVLHITVAAEIVSAVLMAALGTAMAQVADEVVVQTLTILLGLAALLMFVCLLTRSIGIFVYLYRANANIRSTGDTSMTVTPAGMIGWFFVPFANLWKPFDAVRQLFTATESDEMARFGPTPGVVSSWWAAYLVGGIVNAVSSATESTAGIWISAACVAWQGITMVLLVRALTPRVDAFVARAGASGLDEAVAVFT